MGMRETLDLGRAARLSAHVEPASEYVEQLLELAVRGLPASYLEEPMGFAQTLRGVRGEPAPRIRAEGRNLRYGAIAGLGVARLDVEAQRSVLRGHTADDLVRAVALQAQKHTDPGGVAIAAWAAAEVAGSFEQDLFDRLGAMLQSGVPLPIVDVSWMLTAGVMAANLGDTARVVGPAVERLVESQGQRGIFPHWARAGLNDRWRAPIGSFADQVYPIQALSRFSAVFGEADALRAASRTADRICALMGGGGQWWWHYDSRTGDVAERYPVYSVHQHAMAPMALFELAEAGGEDHTGAIVKGLFWLETHPEVVQELVADRHNLIWRKVGRREPPKASRALAAVSAAVSPGLRPPGLDRVFPAVNVDYECRPYELGWLLYAWLGSPVADLVTSGATDRPATAEASGPARQSFFGLNLDALTLPQVVEICDTCMDSHARVTVGVVNAAKVVNLRSNHMLRESLMHCDLLLADGQSVVWASRLLGRPLPERVAGIDLFESLLELGARERRSVFLLGARQDVLDRLVAALRARWPDLPIAGAHHGYFTDEEAPQVAARIAASGADMLFLGITSPKKEIFLARYGAELGVSVLHGVGGSFDVMAGVTKRAPESWQRLGMEWAYRLKQEPRRLARRYLSTNTAFLGLLVRERLRPSLLFAAEPRLTHGGLDG